MFLLIQYKVGASETAVTYFTFHNVSINTDLIMHNTPMGTIFTFHNVSINTKNAMTSAGLSETTLHSTMFLLILNAESNRKILINFTFHNVSINTVLPSAEPD